MRRRADNRLCIHPLVRRIFKNELNPRDENCEEFLSRLWEKFEFQYPVNQSLFKQAAELYKNAAKELQDARGNFSYYAGRCFIAIREFASAYIHEIKAVEIREAVLSETDSALAQTYNDAGITILGLHNRELAATSFMKAIMIFEKAAPENPYLGEAYMNLGETFALKKIYDKAILFTEKAVRFFENQPKLKFKLACARNELGHLMECTGRYDEAMSSAKIAAEIYESLAPPEGSPDLAVAYRNIGGIYRMLGDIGNAIKYVERAIQMQENILPPNHIDVYRSHYMASELYALNGEIGKFYSLSNKLSAEFEARSKVQAAKLLEVTLKLLESDRNMSAETKARNYCKVAESYRKMNNYDSAEKYVLLAEEQLANGEMDSLSVWITHLTAADVYHDKRMFETAVEYVMKAIAVTAPEDFGNLSACYAKLYVLYTDMNNDAAAETCRQRAKELEILDSKTNGAEDLPYIPEWRHIDEH